MMDCYLEEKKHLELVEQELAKALKELETSVSHYEREYKEARRYLSEYWNELDVMERFSNEKSINQITDGGEGAEKLRRKVEMTMDSPYFGKVNFRFAGEEAETFIYIGRFGFCDQWGESLIYDWRAPVSGLYYDYELGWGSFEAPMGTVSGEITGKRQMKVKGGQLEFAVESGLAIGDEVLQKELSNSSDERMKTIIATIQKEQNQLIRDVKAHTLVIQGAAGSGKTSIALHRAAYLLYRSGEGLPVGSVAIFSPNKVFADYISNVLPELGEEPLLELTFEGLAEEEMQEEYLQGWPRLNGEERDAKERERSRLKASRQFFEQMQAYWKETEQNCFQPVTVAFGSVTISEEFLAARYRVHGGLPLRQRFRQMAGEVVERCKVEQGESEKLPTVRQAEKKLEEMCRVGSSLQLYEEFYTSTGYSDILNGLGVEQKEWNDVFPYLYLKGHFDGLSDYSSIRHLIIDEMQDYTPVQYAVIALLFPCRKTILGDFCQKLDGEGGMEPELFGEIFQGAEWKELTRSYRSTKEILEFARRINPDSRAEPIERHGEKPEVLLFDDARKEMEFVKTRARQHKKGTLAVLLKETIQAASVAAELSAVMPVNLITKESNRFLGGVTVTTIAMSKGLEFDEVILPFADSQVYGDGDTNLLYVACTRAMHKLTVSSHKNLTHLLRVKSTQEAENPYAEVGGKYPSEGVLCRIKEQKD